VDAQIKLSVVASDIFGVSGRAMLAALVAGERDPKVLEQLARTRLRAKVGPLVEAFTGFFTDQHAFLLAKMLARVDALDADLADLDAKIQELIAPFAEAVDRLDEIPGVGQLAARLLLAELGLDTGQVPTAGQLVSWAKFAPASASRPANPRAADRPGTATRIWLGCSARPPSPPARPIPSLGNATGGSPADAASGAPSWPSAGHPGRRLAPAGRPHPPVP
jgi:transposase